MVLNFSVRRGAILALGGLFTFLLGSVLNGQQPRSTPATEAERVARELWAKLLAHCGDSYYYNTVDEHGHPLFEPYDVDLGVFQYKTPSFDVAAIPLTAANKLNGVEWAGYAILKATNYRVLSFSSAGILAPDSAGWREVLTTPYLLPLGPYPNFFHPSLNTVGMTKYKGVWSFYIAKKAGGDLRPDGNGNFGNNGGDYIWRKKSAGEPVTPDDLALHKIGCSAVNALK